MKSKNLTVILLLMEKTLTESKTTIIKRLLLYKSIVHVLLILFLSLLAYSNTFHSSFHFDDEPNIVNNPVIKDLSFYIEPSKAKVFKGFAEYPMLKNRYIGSLTFALNYRVHRFDVTGYHIVNLLIHIINALLVYLLVLLTFRTPHLKTSSLMRNSKYIALFSALLFVSHPIQTQAVTYIVQRFASLATMFYLLSLVAYIKWRLSYPANQNLEPGTRRLKPAATLYILYIISVFSAVLAMKTKEIAFTLPIVIALYEFMFFEGKIKRRLLYLLPLLLTMLIIPVSLIGLDKPIGELIGDVGEKTMVQDISRYSYLLTQFSVIVTYIRLIFLPINQNLDYNYPVFHLFFNPEVFLSFLFLLSILGLGGYMLYRSRVSEPGLRLAAFGIFWFFVTLSVESGIIPLHVIYEHRVYLPSVGAFTAMVTGAFLTLRKLENKKIQTAGIAFLILLIIVFSVATYARNTVWQSELTLWKNVVRNSPQKTRALYNLGNAYKDEGLIGEAIEHYQIAIRLNPNHVLAHHNLGSAYYSKGLTDKAIEHYQIAIRLNPNHVSAYYNLGNIYRSKGLTNKAIEYYKRAINLKPDYADAYINLGIIYKDKGLLNNAIEHYNRAISLMPNIPDAHYNIGNAYMLKGLTDKAIEHYNRAISLKPDDPDVHNNLGVAYKRKGLLDKAQEHFRIAENLKNQKR